MISAARGAGSTHADGRLAGEHGEAPWKRHHLQWYNIPPENDVPLGEIITLASERLRALLVVEAAGLNAHRGSEEYNSYLNRYLGQLHLPFSILGTKRNVAPSAKDVEMRLHDVLSHYALAVAYSSTDEKRQWLVQQETNLFRWRLSLLPLKDVEHFLEANRMSYAQLKPEEKEEMAQQLCAGTVFHKARHDENDAQALIRKMEFFEVPFEDATDLVRTRRVFIRRGVAYVPVSELFSIITARFHTDLAAKMDRLAETMAVLQGDSRIALLKELSSVKSCAPPTNSVGSNSDGEVTVQMLEEMSKKSFPPCMRRLYAELKTKHHLRHGGRMQLGLFLKKLGLPLQASLQFWSSNFCTISATQFEQRYAYNIRHNYGMEGKRVDYPAYSCVRIIMGNVPGPMDAHGCPFRHCDASKLQSLLRSWGMGQMELNKIMQYVGINRYDKACTAFLAFSHGIAEDSVTELVSHPNQYAKESRRILKSSVRPS